MTKTHTMLRVTAVIIGGAVILSLTYIYALLNPAQAVALDQISDTVTDSAPSAADVGHSIFFDVAATGAGVPNDDASTIFVIFDSATYGYNSQGPDAYDLSTLTLADIDVEIQAVDQTLIAAPCSGGANMAVTINAGTPDYIAITNCLTNTAIVATDTVEVQIGPGVAAGATNGIGNPATASVSYPVTIHTDADATIGGPTDQGETRNMVIDTVTMTAQVGTNLDCSVAGLADGVTVNGLLLDSDSPGGPANIGTATATSLDFDWIVPNDAAVTDRESLGQDLLVTTNAANGFIWTVEQDQNMTSGIGTDIDLFADNGATTTPSTYTSPSINIADENTWGHYGFTSEDADLNVDTGSLDDVFDDIPDAVGCAAAPCFAGNLAAARTIFAATQPADGSTANIGATQWAVQAEISSLQEAATDYSNVLTHICTPTF